MGRIRQKTSKPKIYAFSEYESQGCFSEQYPWLSFLYMTCNKNHSLEFLEKIQGKQREENLLKLYKRFEELTSQPWIYWEQQPKRSGLETIPYDRLKFSSNSRISLSKDTPLYVFRFDTYQGSGKGRMIGFKKSPCAAFHIIGYDFDFSAYSH